MSSLTPSTAQKTSIAVGVGLGALLLGFIIRRWMRRSTSAPAPLSGRVVDAVRHESVDRLSSQGSIRRPPRIRTDRASSAAGRGHSSLSTSLPPIETDLAQGVEALDDALAAVERALAGADLISNRSDSDRALAQQLTSLVNSFKDLRTSAAKLLAQSGYVVPPGEDVATARWSAIQSTATAVRAGTLSVLSDDSFMSAVEEFATGIDDEPPLRELNLEKSELRFYQEGLEAATTGQVPYRKSRVEYCQCDSETDFAAKLYCLRIAFEDVLSDEHHRTWLLRTGRQLLADLLRHSRQEPRDFLVAFDAMIEYLERLTDPTLLYDELATRRVPVLGFWDVVIDFILLDSFDDLKNPPSAVYSVTKNRFLSDTVKLATIRTIIWSMLKAKRRRLEFPDGFISHFYAISEAVSPAITLGFLGTDERVGQLCQFFKEQVLWFVADIYSTGRVRFTSRTDLAEDLWVALQTRAENIQTRLSSELLPS